MDTNLDYSLLIRENDGYINATYLCKKGNKKIAHWTCQNKTKLLIKTLSKKLNIDESKLIECQKGGDPKTVKQGSWIHPHLAHNLANWISVEFELEVAIWINEWKALNNNQKRYFDALKNIKPDRANNCIERDVRDRLAQQLDGFTEVQCKSGHIDILTADELIEVKHINSYKHAIGQVLCYNYEFHKQMRIHLFHSSQDCVLYDESHINNICAHLNIVVSYEILNEI